MSTDGEKAPEILIIRRGGGDDNAAHKGGAWKIAYADFVTAMMAFFLVMWLINSANEVTKARVASYFNPIKMTDATPSKRGLKEVQSTTQPKQNPEQAVEDQGGNGAQKTEHQKSQGVADLQKQANLAVSETELLQDPFKTLDEIVRNGEGLVEKTVAGANTQIIGDPFDPRSHEALNNAQRVPKEGQTQKTEGNVKKPPSGVEERTAQSEGNQPVKSMAASEDEGPGENPKPTAEKKSAAKAAQAEKAKANALRGEIEELHAAFKEKLDIDVNVKVTDEGILVALEDRKKGSMFAVGSAVPNPALIDFIGKIGAALAKREDAVVVRGHTDARQYANKVYDNWQLSTSRAHISSYMLMRGGLPEERLSRIEGFGSSKLLVPEDPFADANRRVEFLLLTKK